MKFVFIFLIFVFSTSFASAQKRPMSLAVIEPKLDSIKKEAAILYEYTTITRTASKKASEKLGNEISASEIIVYPKSDKLVAVASPKNSHKIYQAHFMSGFDEAFWDTVGNITLSEEEKNLFELKDTLVKQSSYRIYNVIMPEGFGLDYTLFPINGVYHFYILTTTEEKNLIPFGNAYIFISDREGNIQTFEKIYPKFHPMKAVNGERQSIIIWPPYPKEEPFIHAADICNFRIYGVSAGVEKLGVHSIRNKRTTYYDPALNEFGFEP